MTTQKTALGIADEVVLNKIYEIRGEKVMFDRDLADLYGVETKYLKRQVKRNIDRFPTDFMFELTTIEFENWRCQFGTSNSSIKIMLKSIISNNPEAVANCGNLIFLKFYPVLCCETKRSINTQNDFYENKLCL